MFTELVILMAYHHLTSELLTGARQDDRGTVVVATTQGLWSSMFEVARRADMINKSCLPFGCG